MTASPFPRRARLIAIVAVVAVAVPLVAQERASGFHDPAWIEPLLDRPDFTLNVVSGDGYTAWTESPSVCCSTELGYANGAGFIQPEYLTTFKAMLRTPGGEVTQLNPDGVWASVGGIDRGVLAYASGRTQADLRLLDLRTRKRLRLPRGVNTPKVEYDPSISGNWLLFGRVRPDTDSLWADTSVVLVNLKTGESRVLSTGKNYRTYTYPGQVNGDWVSFTACKFNKYGPNCGVSRYQISTGERTNANLDGLCCAHGDPYTQNDGGAAPTSGVSASAVTKDGVVYVAMRSGQNTSWCAYSEIHIWDREHGFGYLFGDEEDEPRHDEPYIGLVVRSLYVDDADPHDVVLSGYTTHEDHGYDCDVESSALYVLHRGDPPPPPATPTPSPSPSPTEPPETPSPSPSPTEEPTPTPTPSPPPSSSPSPPPTPTPSPGPSCPLPICP